MSGLCSDALDIARIEAGTFTFETIEFDPAGLLAELASVYTELAAQRQIRRSIEVDPTIPTRLCGDPTRLRQVLGNVLANALKFTQQGTITLDAKRSGTQDAQHRV